VPSIEEYLRRQALRPLHQTFREVFDPELLRQMLAQRSDRRPLAPAQEQAWDEAFVTRLSTFFDTAQRFAQTDSQADDDLDVDILRRRLEEVQRSEVGSQKSEGGEGQGASGHRPHELALQTLIELRAALHLPHIAQRFPWPRSKKYREAVAYLLDGLDDGDEGAWLTLISYALLHRLGELIPNDDPAAQARAWYHDWLLDKELSAVFQTMGLDPFRSDSLALLTGILIRWQNWHLDDAIMTRPYSARPRLLLQALLEDEDVRQFLGVNLYQGVAWYNQEAMERLLHSLFSIAALELVTEPAAGRQVARALVHAFDVIRLITIAHNLSGYRLDRLMELV